METIRPCDNCGGRGNSVKLVTPTNPKGLCPACVDMPWLRCEDVPGPGCVHRRRADLPWWVASDFEHGAYAAVCGGHWKPDPSTVMHWCQVHQSTIDDEALKCHYWHRWKVWKEYEPDCVVVWVECPTALKGATDGEPEDQKDRQSGRHERK